MNTEFEKRQMQVFELLELLASRAKTENKTLVFIGGSAIQAVLKKPRRLSIDLDLFYDGKPEPLLSVLESDYQVEKRPVKSQDLFFFYTAVRNQVKVKIDIARFSFAKNSSEFESKTIDLKGKKFRVNIAKKEYLLASKLASLCIGTIGREFDKSDFQMNFLKDVFDSNCLLDETLFSEKIKEHFNQICKIQNHVRKTSFTSDQSIENAIHALFQSVDENSKRSAVSKGNLQSFTQYLRTGIIKKADYWEMTYRLIAVLQIILSSKNCLSSIEKMEKLLTFSTDKEASAKMEKQLISQFDPKHIHELKILAPKTLAYLVTYLEESNLQEKMNQK
ncbi:MAG: nucleotidyl transferase AbiEii/AbiGii toxin family protein [Candidatus Diapherotrites archaeon]|nr:nucleotidyl transferase AbiEii/AbiGii toxin family protein [Candidatus Diapherotrites archaeon]